MIEGRADMKVEDDTSKAERPKKMGLTVVEQLSVLYT
jgi:hypothetical protein